MNRRKIFLLISLTVLVVAFILLYTGSGILEAALNNSPYIPVGTLTTWLGMIAFPLAVYWGSKGLRQPATSVRRSLAAIVKFILALAILWAPICYLLAGNWAYNFSEVAGFQGGQEAMRWFWRLSYGIPIASVLVLIAYWISALAKKLGRNS